MNTNKTKVNMEDVVELCTELSIIRSSADDFDTCVDEISEELSQDLERFLCRYTSALLNAIDFYSIKGHDGKEVSYKGFSKSINNDNLRVMLLRKEMDTKRDERVTK